MTKFLEKSFLACLLLSCLLCSVFAADEVRIRPDAPSRYEVVKGDTLWDISGRFLEDPWRWPEVWRINPQIENPDLIYPGDIIELSYSEDGPRLTLSRGGSANPAGLPVVKLSPRVRREAIRSPVPAIPLDVINPVLSGNRVVSKEELDNSPYLLRDRRDTLFSGSNDVVFAKGNWDDNVANYDIVREGRGYIDPDTGKSIGYEGKLVGTASIIDRDGRKATLVIGESSEEIRPGDRFIPKVSSRIDPTYFPVPPDFQVDARIVDIVSGKSVGGLYDSLVINKGSSTGLEVGHLLTLQKPDIVVEDNVGKASLWQKFTRSLKINKENVQTFSGENYASVLIYRVFENASFGIVLETDQPVRLEDRVTTP